MNTIEVVESDGVEVVLRVASKGERDLRGTADAIELIRQIADAAGLEVHIEDEEEKPL